MEYIEAPKIWTRLPGQPSVFLAGGIIGCPNWQRELAKMLTMTNYAVLNPRRENFPIHEGASAAELQIRWEFEHLRKADVVSFWFCKETIQPSVLFELGSWSRGKDPAVVIGIEPGYPRELDVRIQMELLGRSRIVSSLEDLANEIRLCEPSIRSRLSNKHLLPTCYPGFNCE